MLFAIKTLKIPSCTVFLSWPYYSGIQLLCLLLLPFEPNKQLTIHIILIITTSFFSAGNLGPKILNIIYPFIFKQLASSPKCIQSFMKSTYDSSHTDI